MGREALRSSDMPNPYPALVQLIKLVFDGTVDKPHQDTHFPLRSIPVLGGERVQRQDLDAELHCSAQYVAQILHTGTMARGTGESTSPRPTAIPVHNDGHLAGYSGQGHLDHGASLTDRAPCHTSMISARLSSPAASTFAIYSSVSFCTSSLAA